MQLPCRSLFLCTLIWEWSIHFILNVLSNDLAGRVLLFRYWRSPHGAIVLLIKKTASISQKPLERDDLFVYCSQHATCPFLEKKPSIPVTITDFQRKWRKPPVGRLLGILFFVRRYLLKWPLNEINNKNVAELVERSLNIWEVQGSTPHISIFYFPDFIK